jgi:hypothetical protein
VLSVERDVLLGLAGVERGHLRRGGAALPALGHAVEDLAPPLREVLDDLPRDAVDVGDAVLDRLPGQAQSLRELLPQHGLIEEAGGAGLPVEVAAIQRRPAPVRSSREVPRDDVRVQQRVAGARRAMGEGSGHEALASDLHDPAAPSAGAARLALHVAHRLRDGRVVAGPQLLGYRRIPDRP